MATWTKQEKAQAIERLRVWIKPGDTVHCILRHVSRSGLSRVIQCVKLEPHPDIPGAVSEAWLGYNIAQACGYRYDRQREGVIVGGCGMDMGFAVVYDLGRTLYGAGFGCIGDRCPSNDHSNGDRDYTPHDDGTPRTAAEVGTDMPGARAHRHYHTDGGYALKHRWL